MFLVMVYVKMLDFDNNSSRNLDHTLKAGRYWEKIMHPKELYVYIICSVENLESIEKSLQ
jgi:hypothetical protein